MSEPSPGGTAADLRTLRWLRRRRWANAGRAFLATTMGKFVVVMVAVYVVFMAVFLLAVLSGNPAPAPPSNPEGASSGIFLAFDVYLPFVALMGGATATVDPLPDFDLLFATRIPWDTIFRERRTFQLRIAAVAAFGLGVIGGWWAHVAYGVPIVPTMAALGLLALPVGGSWALLGSVLADGWRRVSPAREDRILLGAVVAGLAAAVVAFPSLVAWSLPVANDPGIVGLSALLRAQTDWAVGVGTPASYTIFAAAWTAFGALGLFAFLPRSRWIPKWTMAGPAGLPGVEKEPEHGWTSRISRRFRVRYRNRGPARVASDFVEVTTFRSAGLLGPGMATVMVLFIALVFFAPGGSGSGPVALSLLFVTLAIFSSFLGSVGVGAVLISGGTMLRLSPIPRRTLLIGVARPFLGLVGGPLVLASAVMLGSRPPAIDALAGIGFLASLYALGVAGPLALAWRFGVLGAFGGGRRLTAGSILQALTTTFVLLEGFSSFAVLGPTWGAFALYWSAAAALNFVVVGILLGWLWTTDALAPDQLSGPGTLNPG